jgi:hypothetical protein
MYELSQIILWILWRLRPAMAVEANLVDILTTGFTLFQDEETLRLMADDPDYCATVTAALADAHTKLDLFVYIRACEIAGLRSRARDFIPNRTATSSGRTPQDCWSVFRRLVIRFDDRERLAQKRAERLQREQAQSPLRLRTACASTSPTPCAEEENHRRLSSSSAPRWGRWIGASSRRDGGGSLRARGPPPNHDFRLPIPHCLAATCEVASRCPSATILTALFTKNLDSPACEKHKKRTQQGTRTEQEHERAGQLLRCKRQLLQVRAFWR